MKIIGYLRVSTDQQVESGLGLEAQESACKEYAKRMGLEIAQFFRDEGLSGSLPVEKRDGLKEALNNLKRTDVLVIAKRDRLSRDLDEIGIITKAIKGKGAKIISAAGEGTENADNTSSVLMRRMADVFAEHERLLIGDRTRAALKAKKNRGERVGHIPFGYKLAQDNIHLEQNELECSVINNMKELRAKGLSIRDIAIELNKRSLLNREGAKWKHASLFRIMKNQNVLNK